MATEHQSYQSLATYEMIEFARDVEKPLIVVGLIQLEMENQTRAYVLLTPIWR